MKGTKEAVDMENKTSGVFFFSKYTGRRHKYGQTVANQHGGGSLRGTWGECRLQEQGEKRTKNEARKEEQRQERTRPMWTASSAPWLWGWGGVGGRKEWFAEVLTAGNWALWKAG